MKTAKVNTLNEVVVYSKWKDYTMLIKLRLSLVVVFTSILGYLIASGGTLDLLHMLLLFIGGMLTTGSANALNQTLEKDFDSLMTRTQNRPLAAGRMKTTDAVLFAGLSCLVGITILAFFNPVTAILGMISLIIYSFIYTPLKRYSTIAVAVGAIPGALPVLIGYTSFSGTITTFALVLLAIQFLWQFPHFWAIGYLAFDDYKQAGYKLLPEKNEIMDPNVGLHACLYALLIIPLVATYSFVYGDNILPTLVVSITSIVYAWLGYKMYKEQNRKSALNLMFGSFFYMPIVLIAYLIWI